MRVMTRLAQVLAVASLCGAALAVGAARAQLAPGNSNAPTDVTADQLEMVDAQHMAIWKGNVEAIQDGRRLVSDVLSIHWTGTPAAGSGSAKAKTKTTAPATGAVASVSESWGSIKEMVADGHVFFVSTNQTARGDHAVYNVEPDTITMTGDVVMVQGDNVVKGDKVVIQVKTGHADIISNTTGRNKPERVRGVFYNANQTAPGQPGPAAAPAGAAPAKP
jgi:lipopolysaccharide export system protein LptA